MIVLEPTIQSSCYGSYTKYEKMFLSARTFIRMQKQSLCFNSYLYIYRYCMTSVCQNVKNSQNIICLPYYLSGADDKTVQVIHEHFKVYENFVSEAEEKELIKEIDPILKRRRYEKDHWDDAIKGYKETEKPEWNETNTIIIERLRNLAFPSKHSLIRPVHVLDLAKDGYIKPHIDSIRFCGDTIAGISLLSASVMRLVMEDDKTKFADVLLPQRSLYIMRGIARYKFTHEILEDAKSFFKGKHIARDRRISVICRNEPLGNT